MPHPTDVYLVLSLSVLPTILISVQFSLSISLFPPLPLTSLPILASPSSHLIILSFHSYVPCHTLSHFQCQLMTPVL